jgi:hypothetical protein
MRALIVSLLHLLRHTHGTTWCRDLCHLRRLYSATQRLSFLRSHRQGSGHDRHWRQHCKHASQRWTVLPSRDGSPRTGAKRRAWKVWRCSRSPGIPPIRVVSTFSIKVPPLFKLRSRRLVPYMAASKYWSRTGGTGGRCYSSLYSNSKLPNKFG